MMLSIFVYTTTFLILFAFALCFKNSAVAIINNRKIFRRWDILMSLFFAVVFGLRYDVGIDYESYKDIYEYQNLERFEYLFKYITKFLHDMGFHVVFYFCLWAFGQIFFLLKSFKDEKFIYPSLIFTLFSGQYFLLWMNVIRQDLAACIFIYSISFIVNKSFIKYLLCIVVAFGLHKSALLLLVFYPLFQFRKNFFGNVSLQLFLLLVSMLFGIRSNDIMKNIDVLFETFVQMGEYDVYTSNAVANLMSDVKIGATFISGLLIDVLIIVFSGRMKLFYKNDRFLCFYDLYFGGACANYLLAQSYILLRPVRYFRFFKMIISAYLIYFLYKDSSFSNLSKVALFVLVLCYMYLFIAIFRYSDESKYIYQFFYN